MKKYFIEYSFNAEHCTGTGDMDLYWNGEQLPTADDIRGHLETPMTGKVLDVEIESITELSND